MYLITRCDGTYNGSKYGNIQKEKRRKNFLNNFYKGEVGLGESKEIRHTLESICMVSRGNDL